MVVALCQAYRVCSDNWAVQVGIFLKFMLVSERVFWW